MAAGTVALLGNLGIDRGVFDSIAATYGWTVTSVENLLRLRETSASTNVVAVLFSAPALDLSWTDALEKVLERAPRALPIVCSTFAESIRWSDLADAGAFHEIHVPIDAGEVTRSLGFVWAAKRGESTDEQSEAASRDSLSAISRKTGASRLITKP